MTMDAATTWPALTINERRVLGVLVEKQKTTDTYPLSLNAIVTGSNQKSNRDPILELEDIEVEEALASCQKNGLVMRVISGRVDKWKHLLYDAWKVNSVELAVLAELLLRGPQTEGELRARASRMEEIADIDALRQVLAPLKERRLIIYLTPEGRRGTIVTHGFHQPHELERLRTHFSSQPVESHSEPAPALRTEPDTSKQRLEQLEHQVEDLRAEVSRLAAAVQSIQKELGINES